MAAGYRQMAGMCGIVQTMWFRAGIEAFSGRTTQMGIRGPQRKPGSRRWNQEMKKRARLAATATSAAGANAGSVPTVADLPNCPKGLPKQVAAKWQSLLIDMVAVGIPVRELDSRSIRIVAGYEADLDALEIACADGDIEPEQRLAAIRLRSQIRREWLAALVAIGATPLARLRAGIRIDESAPNTDDPWASL